MHCVTVQIQRAQQHRLSLWTGRKALRLRNRTQRLQAFAGGITLACGRRQPALHLTAAVYGQQQQVLILGQKFCKACIFRPIALTLFLITGGADCERPGEGRCDARRTDQGDDAARWKKCCRRSLLDGWSSGFTVDAIVPPSPSIAACVRELCHTQRNTSLDLKRPFGLPT